MLRLSFFVLASAVAFSSYVQALDASSVTKKSTETERLQNIEIADEFTDLEHQLIEDSGLLSLSQQIKSSAQRLIAGAIEKPVTATINHAQHFSIAKNLAKGWTEEAWQQRLLVLIHKMPVAKQVLIQRQLSHPMVKAAQRKERAAISVQNDPAYQVYMNKLRQRPPASSRWKLVENLDKQSGFSQIIIQARAVVIKEILQQVKGWQPAKAWKAEVRQDVLEFLFYAYRKTPNSELKQIADSFKQPELSEFYKDVLATIK